MSLEKGKIIQSRIIKHDEALKDLIIKHEF